MPGGYGIEVEGISRWVEHRGGRGHGGVEEGVAERRG